jgi:hypothetical protein
MKQKILLPKLSILERLASRLLYDLLVLNPRSGVLK